jgi:hypothetical protein
MQTIDPQLAAQLQVDPLTHAQQKQYKYIIYIEGNVAAFRGAYLFSMGSVVLWVKPRKYHLWFEGLLLDRVNCLIIESDLSNLCESIEYLRENDEAAQHIAANGQALYDNQLKACPIIKYTYHLLNEIAHCGRQ